MPRTYRWPRPPAAGPLLPGSGRALDAPRCSCGSPDPTAGPVRSRSRPRRTSARCTPRRSRSTPPGARSSPRRAVRSPSPSTFWCPCRSGRDAAGGEAHRPGRWGCGPRLRGGAGRRRHRSRGAHRRVVAELAGACHGDRDDARRSGCTGRVPDPARRDRRWCGSTRRARRSSPTAPSRNDGDATVDVIGRSARGAPFSTPHDVLTGRPATRAKSAGDEDGGERARHRAAQCDARRGRPRRGGLQRLPRRARPSRRVRRGAFGVALAATRAADGTWRSAEALSRPSRSIEADSPALGLGPQGAPRAYYVEEGFRREACSGARVVARRGPTDRTPPVVTASLAAGNRVGNKGIGPVRIRVRCDEACDAHAELGSYVLSVTAPLRAVWRPRSCSSPLQGPQPPSVHTRTASRRPRPSSATARRLGRAGQYTHPPPTVLVRI